MSAATSVQVGPVEVPYVALAGAGALLAVAAIVHGATRPVRQVPRGRAQFRALGEIDRRLDRLSRERAKARDRIEKARNKVSVEKEKTHQLLAAPRSPSVERRIHAKIDGLEKRQNKISLIAERIESNSIKPSEIRELMASGALRLRK